MIDWIIAVCTILLAAVYLYGTSQLPLLEILGDPMGTKAVPTILGIGMVIASLLLVVETASRRRKGDEKGVESKEKRSDLLLIGAVVLWTIIFLMFFESLGFLLSSVFYVFVLMAYFNRKKWWTNAFVSIGFSVGMYVLFAKILGVILSKGILYF